MTRQILLVVGTGLFAVGGSGIIIVLVWLTASNLHGTLPDIYDAHAQALLFLLPAVLLAVALVGAVFISGALSATPREDRSTHILHPHTHSHA
jgi:hypothetical protein